MTRLLLLLCLLLGQITFQRTYGGEAWDVGYSVIQTSGGVTLGDY